MAGSPLPSYQHDELLPPDTYHDVIEERDLVDEHSDNESVADYGHPHDVPLEPRTVDRRYDGHVIDYELDRPAEEETDHGTPVYDENIHGEPAAYVF